MDCRAEARLKSPVEGREVKRWRNFAVKVNREMYSRWRDDDKIKESFLEWTLGHVYIVGNDPRKKEWLMRDRVGKSRSKVLEVSRAARIQRTCFGIDGGWG